MVYKEAFFITLTLHVVKDNTFLGYVSKTQAGLSFSLKALHGSANALFWVRLISENVYHYQIIKIEEKRNLLGFFAF